MEPASCTDHLARHCTCRYHRSRRATFTKCPTIPRAPQGRQVRVPWIHIVDVSLDRPFLTQSRQPPESITLDRKHKRPPSHHSHHGPDRHREGELVITCLCLLGSDIRAMSITNFPTASGQREEHDVSKTWWLVLCAARGVSVQLVRMQHSLAISHILRIRATLQARDTFGYFDQLNMATALGQRWLDSDAPAGQFALPGGHSARNTKTPNISRAQEVASIS